MEEQKLTESCEIMQRKTVLISLFPPMQQAASPALVITTSRSSRENGISSHNFIEFLHRLRHQQPSQSATDKLTPLKQSRNGTIATPGSWGHGQPRHRPR